MIGLLGAHRTGKTTLAEAFAREQRLPFLRTSVSSTFKRLARDPSADYPIEERLAIQSVVLESLTMQYERQSQESPVFVTDRTPLDLAAYMLADVQRTSCIDPGFDEAVMEFVTRCMDMANRFLSLIVLVQPGIPWVPEEGKPLQSRAYQEHINALSFGMILDPRFEGRSLYIPRSYVALEERKRALFNAATHSIGVFKELASISKDVVH